MKVKSYFDMDDDRQGRKPASATTRVSVRKGAEKGRPTAPQPKTGGVQTQNVKVGSAGRTSAAPAAKSAQKPVVKSRTAAGDEAVRLAAVRRAVPEKPQEKDELFFVIEAAPEELETPAQMEIYEATDTPADLPLVTEPTEVQESAAAQEAAAQEEVVEAPVETAQAAPSAAGLRAAAFKSAFAQPDAPQPQPKAAPQNEPQTEDVFDDDEEDDWDMEPSGRGKRGRKSRDNGGDDGGKKRLPIGWVIVFDVLIAALLLGVFSLFYIIIPWDMSANETELPRPTQTAVATPAPTESLPAEPTATEAPEPTPTSDGTAWGMKFPGVFTDGEVVQDEMSYKSGNISMTIEKKTLNEVNYYVADIYIKDYQYLRCAFGGENRFGYRDVPADILAYAGGILGVNGDFCTKNEGVVVRNGVLCRDKMHDSDLLVLNYDGTMQTYSPEEFDVEKIKAEGVWQVWTFGPELLSDGQPMTEFNTTSRIAAGNPRTAVGYYEPGHYCFVVSDGRSPQPTAGFTMAELSQLMYDMGCTVAYNMDGGKSSEMVFLGRTINEPYEGGRDTSDIIYIADDKGGF